MSLPTPRRFLTSLLSPPPEAPIPTLPSSAKPALLTLHHLFPHTLLHALDLLDRNLVTRLTVPVPSSPNSSIPNSGITAPTRPNPPLYLVHSAQTPRPNTRDRDTTGTIYEVRPWAWSCSCAAFAFAAFPARDASPSDAAIEVPELALDAWIWGGPAHDPGVPPVCKHLLAAMLAEKWGLGDVPTRDVTREEVAGWGAGFGD
ncbi:hypothetical protein EJ06DRAFT_583988 [Trichodelitschia bisporula]|uniref:SWIM-type domain-containing protein n=1 Tax=Trichodelitschia bisporula TaxID=703511 RepID=A0A6G1HQS8_9PEZI|nr:hypothetical protein EJ06DRAFT_583988 [Trichodelitschia bisporula]